MFIPEETTYNAEIISGNEFGNLLDPNTNEPVQSFSGLYHWFGYAYFDYIADGTPVDSVDSVTIRINMSDPKIPYKDLTLYIKPSPLVVTVEPEFVAPGDTARLIIKKLNEDGTLIDYDTTQTFEVGMLDGCALGMIKIETDSGAYVYGATQPILFIVDANADTGIVKLRVGLIEETGGSSRSVRNNIYEENIENDKAIKNKVRKIAFEKMMKEKQGNQTTTSPENTESCWGGIASTTIHKKIDIPIIKLIIIYPTPYINEAISREPRMPEVICKAKLSSFYPGKIKYEWKYIVRKYYDRRYVKHSPICTRVSRSEFQGLSYSNFGLEVTEWKVPFEVDSGYFYFKSLQPRKNQYDPLNHIYGCSGESNEWYDSNEEIFTGGDVLITITAKEFHTGKILAKLDTVYSGKIRGLNPDINSIHSYANSNKIKAIMWQEGKTNHFTGEGLEPFYWWPYNEEGWPLYGSPNGYGLMQLDNSPAATERQLWNWKANVDGGKQKLSNAYNEVYEYHGVPNEEKFNLTNAFQYYNNGDKNKKYYMWKGIQKGWQPNLNRGGEYGKTVYDKYIQFGGGN